MKPCPQCRIYNTNEAKVCHQCGTPFPKTLDIWPIIIKTGTAVLVTAVLALGFYTSRRSPEAIAESTQKPASLELLSSRGFPTVSGRMLVEGIVRNISGTDIKKVYVVVSWFDKTGKKLESNNTPISASPFLDRHEASFRVVMSKHPKMDNYAISFVDASGKVVLRVIDVR